MTSRLRKLPYPVISDNDLAVLLSGTSDSRYGKVKRLLSQAKLLHIRRGLYCLTEETGHSKPTHPFALAQHIYGPSYISLHSALSFHGLIPEAVYAITSVSTKRSKEFQTPLGLFSYSRLPSENFYTGVNLVNDNDQPFLIATPWKAICDFIYCSKKDWRTLQPLVDSLRLQIENLPILRTEEMQLLDEYYHHRRISLFLKGVINER